jgi:uncharacterized protein YejL (UPF0352 family)
VAHEHASTYPGRELNSINKRQLQLLCIKLEKNVIPCISDYATVHQLLNEVLKVLEKRHMADLHLMRKLRFVPVLVEICKRISVCPKQELK